MLFFCRFGSGSFWSTENRGNCILSTVDLRDVAVGISSSDVVVIDQDWDLYEMDFQNPLCFSRDRKPPGESDKGIFGSLHSSLYYYTKAQNFSAR